MKSHEVLETSFLISVEVPWSRLKSHGVLWSLSKIWSLWKFFETFWSLNVYCFPLGLVCLIINRNKSLIESTPRVKKRILDAQILRILPDSIDLLEPYGSYRFFWIQKDPLSPPRSTLSLLHIFQIHLLVKSVTVRISFVWTQVIDYDHWIRLNYNACRILNDQHDRK
jgi:hypothetical protein